MFIGQRILALFMFVACVCAQAQDLLTNQIVVKMVQSGVPAGTIVKMIQSADQADFTFLPGDLKMFDQYKVPEEVIKSMAARSSGKAAPVQPISPPVPPVAVAPERENRTDEVTPRIFITDSASWEVSGGFSSFSTRSRGVASGSSSGGARPQTVEIIKTFGERCPGMTITMDRVQASFIVILDHEGGKGYARKDNKIAVFKSGGDLLFSDSTRSLGNAVKDACASMLGTKK